jgi:hypothetical protein
MTINVCKKSKIPENTMAKRKNRTKGQTTILKILEREQMIEQ